MIKKAYSSLSCRTSDKRMFILVYISEKQVYIKKLTDLSSAIGFYEYGHLPISYLSISIGPNKNGLISIEYSKEIELNLDNIISLQKLIYP